MKLATPCDVDGWRVEAVGALAGREVNEDGEVRLMQKPSSSSPGLVMTALAGLIKM